MSIDREPAEERLCMDCGVIVVLRGRRSDGSLRWGETKSPGVWSMTCRREIEDGQLIVADYHYVNGEVQRKFRRYG